MAADCRLIVLYHFESGVEYLMESSVLVVFVLALLEDSQLDEEHYLIEERLCRHHFVLLVEDVHTTTEFQEGLISHIALPHQ